MKNKKHDNSSCKKLTIKINSEYPDITLTGHFQKSGVVFTVNSPDGQKVIKNIKTPAGKDED